MSIKAFLIQGKTRWAKICGAAPPGYQDGPPEWTFDLVLDEKGKKDYLASKGDKFYIKQDKNTGEDFIRFTRKATKQDGTAAKPIRILDHHGEEWDQSKLIGNDSILNVQYTLNEVKSKGTKRFKPSVLAVQVWDFKKYTPKSSFPTVTKPSSNLMADNNKPAETDWVAESEAVESEDEFNDAIPF